MSSRSELLTVIGNLQEKLDVEIIDVEDERELDDSPENLRALQEVERRLTAIAAKSKSNTINQDYAKIRDQVVDLLDTDAIIDLNATTVKLHDFDEIEKVQKQQESKRMKERAEFLDVEYTDNLNLTEDAILSSQRSFIHPNFEMQCFDVQLHYEKKARITTVFRIFGRHQSGLDICLDVKGVPSYFYMLVPKDRARRVNRGAVEELCEDMNAALHYRLRPNTYIGCRRHGCKCEFAKRPNKDGPQFAPRFEPCVTAIESKVKRLVKKCSIVHGRSIVGYHPHEQTFIKIEVEHPFLMSHCTWWIKKQAKDLDSICYGCQLHEATIKPVVRFLVDKNIVGCGWIRVNDAELRTFRKQETRCALECSVNVANITSLPEETKNTPFRVLALDIECMSIDVNVFPTADKCPVIQMSTMGRIYGQPENDEKLVFCLGHEANNTPYNPNAWKTDNITEDGTIINCRNETALFVAIYKYVLKFNPDIITGYNSSKCLRQILQQYGNTNCVAITQTNSIFPTFSKGLTHLGSHGSATSPNSTTFPPFSTNKRFPLHKWGPRRACTTSCQDASRWTSLS